MSRQREYDLEIKDAAFNYYAYAFDFDSMHPAEAGKDIGALIHWAR